MFCKFRINHRSLALLAAASFAPVSRAATMYYDGGSAAATSNGQAWNNGTTADWGNASGGPYTSVWTNGNDAVFEGTGAAVNVASPAGVTAQRMTFNTAGYTVSGGTITLATAGDPVVLANQNATINSNISISGAQTWSVASGKTLTLGNVNAVAAGTNFGLNGNGSYIFKGSIGGNVGSVLFNGGAGVTTTATFTAANTFTGTLHLGVSGGTGILNFSDVNQLGSGTGGNYIAIQNGSTLRYTGTGSQTTGARDLYWNIGAATIDVTEASANLTFDITGGGRGQAFTKSGAGQLTLKKNTAISETTTQSVTVTGGILEYNQNNAGAASYFAGAVTGSTGTQIKVSGAGTVGNANFTADWTANLADMDIAAGGKFGLRGNNITIDALTGGGDLYHGYYSGAGAATKTVTVGVDNGSGTFSGNIHGNNSNGTLETLENGFLALTKKGTGTQILSGANTYTGATTVSAGTLLVNGTHNANPASGTGGAYAVGTTGTSAVTPAATLGGTGTITTTGAFTVMGNGQITAGTVGTTYGTGTATDGIGTLNIAGAGARTLNGTYLFDVNYGAASGNHYNSATGDLLNITGAASLSLTGSSFSLNSVDFSAAPAAGSHYAIKIFSSNVADIAYSGAGQHNFVGATGLQSYQSIVTWDNGKTFYLVPEPASLALLALGSLLLLRRPSRPARPSTRSGPRSR